MLNDKVRVTAASGFQASASLTQVPRSSVGNLEPQDVFLDNRGMLVAIPRLPSISEFDSWSFYV